MPVITINGPLGAGAVSIGQMVAQELEMNFYDRLVFTQAARAHRHSGGFGDRQGAAG